MGYTANSGGQVVRKLRLGDEIDDHCVKCKRITNHLIVSFLEGEPAKVRCRSCYHEHDYLHAIAPPPRRRTKKPSAG